MVRRTVPLLVRIARSSVDGRLNRTTYSMDQQMIRTDVDGALFALKRKKQLILHLKMEILFRYI